MLHDSQLPKYFWSYAYKAAAYLHNQLPKSRVDTSPLQKLYKWTPSLNSLYLFGCKAIVDIPNKQWRGKLGERVQDCYLLGYRNTSAGWWFWSMTERRMIHLTSAVFPEFQALQVKKTILKSNLNFIINKVKLILGEEPTEKITEEERKAFAQLPSGPTHGLPRNIRMALKSPEADEWNSAAIYKMTQFDILKVWESIKPHPGMKVLGACWVFAIKHKPNGTILKYRARYVAKGFNQKMGVDRNEVYAPTAFLNTLRLLLSIAQ
jgi:hypothetical protein